MWISVATREQRHLFANQLGSLLLFHLCIGFEVAPKEELQEQDQIAAIKQKPSVGVLNSNGTLRVGLQIVEPHQRGSDSNKHL